MTLLAFDTATPSTVVGVAGDDGVLLASGRHDPAPGERPGHSEQLLALAAAALAEAGKTWGDLTRVGVGAGPGTFTGLRIGVATARALAQGLSCEVAAVSTLEALALAARSEPGADHERTLAVLDARRREAFVAGWDEHGASVLEVAAVPVTELGDLVASTGPWRCVGDGAVRYRTLLGDAGAALPPDDSPLHRVDPAALCLLAASAPAADRDRLVPEYVREPDAVPRP